MRRALVSAVVLVTAVAALALAGCGSSSSASSASPRDTALSYFAAGSPVVAVISTAQTGPAAQNARAFGAHVPSGRGGLAALQSALAQKGLGQYANLATQIKPLLGNPLAIGAAAAPTASHKAFLLAFVAKDAAKLDKLVRGIPGLRSAGGYDGAKLYQVGPLALAVGGATLVLSGSVADLKGALDVHAHQQGIAAATYDKTLGGLPRNSALTIFGNLTRALAQPSAAKARLIPWVAAIRSYAVTLSVARTGITASYRIDTTAGKLSAAQLPLPLGTTAPSVDAQAPVATGIKQLSHVIAFGEAAGQAVDPAGYAKLTQQVAQQGIDLNKDIVSQFTGDGELDFAPGGGAPFRAQVHDPAAARRTLAKDTELKPIGGGFYMSKKARKPARVGIVGSELVVGQGTPAQLRIFAGAPASPIAGTPGPLAFRVALKTVVALGLSQAHQSQPLNPRIAGLLNMFGDITGYAANNTSSLYGNFALALK